MASRNFRSAYDESLTPEIILKAKNELGETSEVKAKCLRELKHLISKEKNLDCLMDDTFLLGFLRHGKFKTEKAFKTLRNYYQYKQDYRDTLYNHTLSDLKSLVDSKFLNILPYTTENGVAIACGNSDAKELDTCSSEEALGLTLMLIELLTTFESIQICGISIIFDLKYNSYQRLWKAMPYIYAYVKALKDCIPIRIKSYHLLNVPSYYRLAINIGKALVSEKMKKRVFIHSDMKSLHKHLSPDLLPSEWGGHLGPYNNEKSMREMEAREGMLRKRMNYGFKKYRSLNV